MKSKILKISVVMLIIMTLTMSNFIFLGTSIYTYAASNITTNHENIEFETYFKNGNGEKVSTLDRTVDAKELSLFLSVNVKKEGYFNGAVEFINPNFKILNSTSEYVNRIEENKIYFNQINAGANTEIEIKIAPKDEERINIDSLSSTTNVKLTGIYRDSTEKDINIDATREITLKLIENNNTENIENSINVITNKVIKVSGEDKRVIQISLNMGLKNNNYPIKQIYTKINVPTYEGEKPEILKDVRYNSTTAYDYNYDGENVEITLKNDPTENNILWKKQGTENVILTFIYNAEANLENSQITSSEKITLQNDKEISSDVTTTISNEEKDASIAVNASNSENEMYKGKIMAGLDRGYNSTTNLTVNLANVEEKISIKENATRYIIPDNEVAANVLYNTTTISKEQFTKIFGDNGKIEIYNQDGVLITTIDRNTTADENGNIVVNYSPSQPTSIEIRTSTPVGVGTIQFNHSKVVKLSDKEIVRNASELATNITYGYNQGQMDLSKYTAGTTGQVDIRTKLNNSTTTARLELNKDSLSTLVSNDIEMKAILSSNNEAYDLYENPVINIELPQQVESINLKSVNLLYENELKIVNYSVNGRTIIITLEGKQTSYKEPSIEGATIVINAEVTLNKKATSSEESINLYYTNNNVNTYKENQDMGRESVKINVVSPKGLITTNNIEALGIQTIAQEPVVSKMIDKNTDAKQVKVEQEIINNNEQGITNLSIVGTLGTDGKVSVDGQEKENNVHAKLKSGLSIDEIDTNKVKVYYTDNENATNDLQNGDNGWTEEANENSKKYLIQVTDMAQTEGMKVSYDMEIPANLEYNQQLYQGYETTYTENTTGTEGQVDSTVVELTTGQGPVLEATMKSMLGSKELKDGDKIKQGERIKYSIDVKNTGTQPATNVSVEAVIPEGTTLVSGEEITQIEEIPVGESRTVEYEVKINKDTAVDTEIKSTVAIKYDDSTVNLESVTTKVEEGKLSIFVKHKVTGGEEESLVSGQLTSYEARIQNLTDEEMKDVKLTWNLPEEFEIYQQFIVIGHEEMWDDPNSDLGQYMTEVDKNKEITIESIPANTSVLVYTTVQIGQISEPTKNITVSATLNYEGKDYSSNESTGDIINYLDYDVKMSANNENEFIQAGAEINYNITIKNNNQVKTENVFYDEIPSQLTIKEILIDGEVQTISENEDPNQVKQDGNKLWIPIAFEAGEEKVIEIKTVVNYIENMENPIPITNKGTLYVTGTVGIDSNEVKHNLAQTIIDEDGKVVYRINGTAWIDQNMDGIRQDTEEKFSGMNVKLLNVQTNKIATDSSGNEITAQTDSEGNYILSKVPEGNYIVVFEYDSTQYTLTEYKKDGTDEIRNSDVVSKKLNLDGTEKTYAVTDEIKIEKNDATNINIGLIKSRKFDMKLDKYVSRVIVQNSTGTSTYSFDNATMAKVEIDAKQIANSNVVIEYKIRVTNSGELDGYVKNVVDYLPSDVEFSSELNKDWYKEGNNLYNNTLANDIIAAGETRELTLTVTKKMTQDNVGLINNTAEIAQDYNESGITDMNSTPGNRQQGENDMGAADVIISIRTGGAVMYITLTISLIAIIGVGAYFIKKKIIKGNM